MNLTNEQLEEMKKFFENIEFKVLFNIKSKIDEDRERREKEAITKAHSITRKNCPFCKSNLTHLITRSQYSNPDTALVYCDDCHAEGPGIGIYNSITKGQALQQAVILWNNR